MKTRQQKIESLTDLKAKIKGSKIVVFTTFAREGEKGLGVAQLRELKKSLRSVGSEYVVAKKTLLDKALKADKIKDVDTSAFIGSPGIALGNGDEAQTAKSVFNFAKTNPSLKAFGALLGTRFIDAGQFSELAKLPSRDVMIGRTLGMIQYPISGLVNVLQGNIRNLVMVLSAIQSKK